jgi:16S rRNA (guanine527-N7)-methyltransferase
MLLDEVSMEYNLDKFRAGLDELNIALNDRQISRFLTYYEMLIEKNKVMNLTAITEFDEVIEKHFLDSLSICKVYDLSKINQPDDFMILDMGTGAGFPGIPLKIAFPNIKIVLADSLNKRIVFLQDVIQVLELDGIEAVHGRAEEMAKNKKYREQFDLSVSRAVANLSSLSEYCLPFVKTGGKFISYKSGEIEEEVDQAKGAIKKLGGLIEDVYKFNLNEQKRSFVVIRKEKKTPGVYPRKAGMPTKEPLR